MVHPHSHLLYYLDDSFCYLFNSFNLSINLPATKQYLPMKILRKFTHYCFRVSSIIYRKKTKKNEKINKTTTFDDNISWCFHYIVIQFVDVEKKTF